jgi:hypothetical protein
VAVLPQARTLAAVIKHFGYESDAAASCSLPRLACVIRRGPLSEFMLSVRWKRGAILANAETPFQELVAEVGRTLSLLCLTSMLAVVLRFAGLCAHAHLAVCSGLHSVYSGGLDDRIHHRTR